MGPLHGLKIVELAGIGPGPFTAMMLADMGAKVIRIDRTQPADIGIARPDKYHPILRNRKRIALDLKDPNDINKLFKLVKTADGLIEGFRPGTAERLGIGPEPCMEVNPRLVYGRITGWGQDGPLARTAGHDLNYISLTGVLDAIGRKDQPPSIPLTLIGDFGGGALYLAFGMLSALYATARTGQGQVVDTAMLDGTISLATMFYGLQAYGMWNGERGDNLLDSGAPFYDVYQCSDKRWVSVSALESKFFKQLLRRLELDHVMVDNHLDKSTWPAIRTALEQKFREKTRDEWCAILEEADVCFAPVLNFEEAFWHPQIKARQALVDIDGVHHAAPAPKFSISKPLLPSAPQEISTDSFQSILEDWESTSD